MGKSITIAEAREKLFEMPDKFDKGGKTQAIKVTRDKKPVLAIIPWEVYEGIMETQEILSDREFMVSVRESIKELKDGKTISWEEVKKELEK